MRTALCFAAGFLLLPLTLTSGARAQQGRYAVTDSRYFNRTGRGVFPSPPASQPVANPYTLHPRRPAPNMTMTGGGRRGGGGSGAGSGLHQPANSLFAPSITSGVQLPASSMLRSIGRSGH